MLNSKSSNSPAWRDVYTYSKLPEALSKLDELSKNLWWVWNRDASLLFEDLNKEVWNSSFGNPIEVVASLTQVQISEMTQDQAFLKRLDSVYATFRTYMDRPVREDVPSVAYFCMEYGITNVLKIYSGGLGILAGDYIKEASDSRVNMTGVGFLYRYGYFDQKITNDGQQIAKYEAQQFKKLPLTQLMNEDGTPMILEVPFSDHVVYSNIWRADVGRVPLYLLDTDIDQNSEFDRSITHQLYGGDWENRMKQEYLLGIGGVLMLNKLGIKADIYHANEGHAALMNLQRLADLVEGKGMDFDSALELVRSSALYTVHTPVPAGHDYFDEGLFGKYLAHFAGRLGISFQELIDLGRENPGSHDKFSMSVFALNTCQGANGVSKLHGHVSQRMFAPVWKGYLPEELHVGYVTNGVHAPSWQRPEWGDFVKKYISDNIWEEQSDEKVWDRIMEVPDEEVWEMRLKMKQDLFDFFKKRYLASLTTPNADPTHLVKIIDDFNPNALLVGFGRRFATYKRAHLLFTDLEKLSAIVNNPDYPVQFIFTGKAHPADGGGQGLIKRIIEISKRPEFRGKILFIENYDIKVAQSLIAGVDVWLNTPTRPLEASGTSGMKALMNGVLNYSVLDGWWYEGYVEGGGWAITDKRSFDDQSLQDQLDAATIYRTLEDEIIPLYYDRKDGKTYSEGWIKAIKTSMSKILPHFTMRRMIDDYIVRFYRPIAEHFKMLHAGDNAKVKEIVAWKRAVAQHWRSLEVLEVDVTSEGSQMTYFPIGYKFGMKVVLDMHDLDCDLNVDLVIAEEDPMKHILSFVAKLPLRLVAQEGSRRTYQMEHDVDNPGSQKVAVRITPTHPILPYGMDFAYIHWEPLF
ncbi:MAG: alpha-glucan family phosphorylase [Bacteroidales bacterium]|nr:alpha-glucan family phosphorylase [Bacteroidales bacterium]